MTIRLEFEIQVEDGSGLLLLRPRTLFEWLRVERLELQIPNVKFPLDITGGMKQFRTQRCRVLACSLRVVDVAELMRARAGPLAAAGFSELRAHSKADSLEIGGVARVGSEQAELVIRVVPHYRGRSVELEVVEAHLLGLLRRPSWLLAHDLLSVLLGAGSSDGEPLDETAPLAVGLGRVRLRPLDLFLARALPAAGWKVPTADEIQLTAAALDDKGASITWSSETPLAESPAGDPPLAGDAALVKSDLAGAAAAYRGGDQRASDRLLSVLLARETTLKQAMELAQESLARWPNWIPAQLAVAAIEARNHPRAAADAYAAAANGRGELPSRVARAAARLYESSSPELAAELHERVLAERPDDQEAIEALLRHYQARGEWAKLAALYERCAESASDPHAQSKLYFSLGQICAERLDDAARGLTWLERSVGLDAENAAAWAELGRVRTLEKNFAGAIEAFEKLVPLRRGGSAEARTHAHLASLHEQMGELEAAQSSYSLALELAAGEADLWARAATLAEKRGDSALAAQSWAQLVALAPPAEQRRLAEEALLRLAVARKDLPEARRWRDGARHSHSPEVLLELAQLEEEAGDLDGALRTLGATLERLPAERAARVELTRARLSTLLHRDGDARTAWLASWRRAPSSEAGQEALRELSADARARNDSPSEARWLDELLVSAPTTELAKRRGELHAALGEWQRARTRLQEAGAVHTVLFAEVLGHVGDHAARALALAKLAAADASLWISVVEARLELKDLDGAEAALALAMAHAPEDLAVRAAQGELAWERRAWEEVIALFPSLLALSNARARDLVRLAVALERQGAAEDARARYREAVELPEAEGADLTLAWRHLAELEERAGSYQSAAQAWAASAKDSRTGDSAEQRAEKHRRAAELLYRRLGRGNESVEALEAALGEDAAHLPSLDLLESIQTELGNDEALAATLRKRLLVLAGDPRRRELVRRLAELDSRRGDRDGALHAWHWVLEQDPRDPEAMRQLTQAALEARDATASARLAELLPSSGLAVDERRAIVLQLADLLIESGNAEAGERALAAAQALDPPDRAALVEKRVRVLLDRLVDPVAALAAARAEWSEAPEDPRLLTLVAETALAANEPALRAEALTRLMPFAPSPAEWTNLVLEVAELYATRLDDPARAQALYEQVLDADPTRLPAEALKLAAKKARGRADELGLLRALRDSGGAGVDELVRLSQLFAATEEIAASAEALADAVERHVRDLSARGEALDDRGRALVADLSAAAAVSSAYGPAARGMARAAEIELDDAAAASALGEAALLSRTRLDDYPGAAVLLERALERRPDSALLLADLEAVMRRLDDPKRLRRAYELHLQTVIGTGRAPVLLRLALLCRAAGDEESGARYESEAHGWEAPRVAPTPVTPDSGRGRALFLAVAETSSSAPGLSGPELLAAIAELRHQVDTLPAREIEQSRSLRLRLAWMYRRTGDVHAACVEFAQLHLEDPHDRPILSALIETSLLDERWEEAVAALDRLQQSSEDPGERAAALYRMGKVYEEHLAEEERAIDQYLRAIDLDPAALPPLWRLVDHYWDKRDDLNLIDIARLLSELGALSATDAPRQAQARAWVAMALDAFDTQRENLAPPSELSGELTRALGELAERPRPPSSLAAAARRLALASALTR